MDKKVDQNGRPKKGKPNKKDQSNTEQIVKCEQNAEQITEAWDKDKGLYVRISVDMASVLLFAIAAATRFYKLEEPRNIVFDELHYGKYVSLYMKKTFFFDSHPPLGKQLIAIAAHLANFTGRFKFDKIGSTYSDEVPVFALRCVPALFGSLVIPVTYHFMLELGCKQWTAILASFLLICDNALLTQSRFILMEPMLIFFSLFGLLCVLKYIRYNHHCYTRFIWFICAIIFLTLAVCVKYSGIYSLFLAVWLMAYDFWTGILPNKAISDMRAAVMATAQGLIALFICTFVYTGVFYAHLTVLTKAGPHDSVMTSAFQASLEGGLASITKGQPLKVAHGSQVTLRHTHGRTCWLHSHIHTYPIRYSDGRGSSHQQQVTCYTFKDVNNWWIVKRPDKDSLTVGDRSNPDVIKHGDVIQLAHGITRRALNSHDVAAPVSPNNQEVSCYVDYNVSMPAQNLWRVDIANREQVGDAWLSIKSLVRFVHVNTSQALKYSGRQLPEWGFNQHEMVADKVLQQEDTIWNVEEHRYTESEDEKDRERELVNAQMIPLKETSLSFGEKFAELQYKMLFSKQETVQSHMYSSDPAEWPLISRGIAYWVSSQHNGQVHLLGNILIWYTGTLAALAYASLAVFYALRRRRKCYDIPEDVYEDFVKKGRVLFVGYLWHYFPYFFLDKTLFLHHYLPAMIFKTLLVAATLEHLASVFEKKSALKATLFAIVVLWMMAVVYVFRKFSVLSYGTTPLSAMDIIKLRWKDGWDFIIHKS